MKEQVKSKGLREETYHLVGWVLFVLCAFFFIASSVRNEDPLALIASLIFLVACLLFIVPLVMSLTKG